MELQAQAGGARACRLGWEEYGNMAWEAERAGEAKAVLQEGVLVPGISEGMSDLSGG